MSDNLPDFLKFVRRKLAGDGPNLRGDGPNRDTGVPRVVRLPDGGAVPLGGQPVIESDLPEDLAAIKARADSNTGRETFGMSGFAGADAQRRVDPSEQSAPSGIAQVARMFASQEPVAANVAASTPEIPTSTPTATRPRTVTTPAAAAQPDSEAAPSGVEYDPTGLEATPQKRPRWSDPINQESEKNAALRDAADTPKSGWQRYVMPMALGFLNRGLPGAAVGAIEAKLDPRAANRAKYGARIAESDARLGGLRARRKEGLEAEETRAGIRLRNAQAGDIETQKPLRDAAKREDQQKRALLARLKSMPTVDPAKHAAFLSEWREMFGEDFDADAWNNKRGNIVVRGIITDPAKPQQKQDVAINLATGEQKVLGLSGYTPPLDAQGMSENQRRTDSDRDDARENTEEYRARMLGLSSARLRESMLNGLTARAARAFSTKTAGLFAERGRLETQINGYRTRASKREITPAESERRIAELQRRVDEITGQIDDARSEAVGEMGGDSRPRSAAPSSENYAGKRISRSRLPEAAKRLGVSVEEVERRIEAGGGVVY